jgi:eukaryotic-like serine/threonine-protein kinase
VNEDDALEPALPALPAFASRPDGDVLARAVSRARIENLMFAAEERVTLGRYHLLSRIGAGGMGTVWGAFDPELDRKVAIKLLKEELAADRDRIVVEGKSLAKLAHPNVVTIHDVGVVDEQVYIVMEWVHGKTLRDYVRDATPRDIIAAYRAAGEGLAAAHAAGLVHRDFKPDNAIVGDDTRVRVLDFGLARDEPRADAGGIDTVTRGAGTPRYMAPEQAAGGELTPAADQFAFCVSLRESLDGQVPKWVHQIIARGTAPVPAARYPSMRALLDALAKDPAVIWRRRLLAGGAVAVAGAAFAIGSLQASDDVERCTGGQAEIAKVWSPQRAATLTAHLQSLGAYGTGEAERLIPIFAQRGKQWAKTHRDSCLAQERGELTPLLYERRLACLTRVRAALDTLLELVASADSKRLASVTNTMGALPSPESCLEADTSTVLPPPADIAARATELGADIERARVRALALTADAIEFAKGTEKRAVELGYRPLVGRANLELGRAYVLQSQIGSKCSRFCFALIPLTSSAAVCSKSSLIAVRAR